MYNTDEIGQMLSDQVSEFIAHLGHRKMPLIEVEYDDEGTTDRLFLDRWQDRAIRL